MAMTADQQASPRCVAESQVAIYVANGYLVIPDRVSPVELDELKPDIIKVARGSYPNQTIQPVPAQPSDEQMLSRSG